MFVFFFQAEDGIRGLVRSRGLGDVYKRQEEALDKKAFYLEKKEQSLGGREKEIDELKGKLGAVSYTHLTLPTIYSV